MTAPRDLRWLVAKWREKADGPIPTDRAIGIVACADELEAALGEVAPPAAGPERCSEHPHDPLVLVCAECFESEKTAAATERAEAAERELQGGHARLDECAGWEATKGQPLYARISAKIQQLSYEKAEIQHMLTAEAQEKDELRARAGAAEHRRAAAEYRAQRIVLDAELTAALALADTPVVQAAAFKKRLDE